MIAEEETTEEVTVTVEVPPFSAIGLVGAGAKVICGVASSSTSVIVWLCVPFSLALSPPLTLAMSMMIVSSGFSLTLS